jgi:hypothetical protein
MGQNLGDKNRAYLSRKLLGSEQLIFPDEMIGNVPGTEMAADDTTLRGEQYWNMFLLKIPALYVYCNYE